MEPHLWLSILFANIIHFHLSAYCFAHQGYREHSLINDQLCPDPVRNPKNPRNIKQMNRNVAHIRPPQALLTELHRHSCMLLLQDGSSGLIRAISTTADPWNYKGAEKCEGMIQLDLYTQESRTDAAMWCQIDRWKNNIYGGKYFDPQIWFHPRSKIGIYFSTTGWDSTFHLEDIHPTSAARPMFLQLAINVMPQDAPCSLVVQQYVINHKRNECRPWDLVHQNCGIYSCGREQKRALNQMGFSYIHIENETDSENSTTDIYLDIFNRAEALDRITIEKKHFDSFLFIAELFALVIASVIAVNVCLYSVFRSRKLSGRRRSDDAGAIPQFSSTGDREETYF